MLDRREAMLNARRQLGCQKSFEYKQDLQHDEREDKPDCEEESERMLKLGSARIRIGNARARNKDRCV